MLPRVHKGRGATLNPDGRFERRSHEPFDDGWGSLATLADDPSPRTEAMPDASRTILATNDSPDIPFDQSINPYRGCEHGCVYCYARPSHSYLGLSAGIDFETKIFVKYEAAELLKRELARPGYVCRPISSARIPTPTSHWSAGCRSRAACWKCWPRHGIRWGS